MNSNREFTNIAYIIPSLSEGGAELPTISQINHLYKKGINVYLIVLSNVLPAKDLLDIPDRNILVLNTSHFIYNKKGILNVINSIWRMKRFIDTNQIKIVVAMMNLSHFAGRLIKLIEKLKGTRIRLIIYHQTSFYDTNLADNKLKKLMNYVTYFMSYLLDDYSIFISSHVKNEIMKYTHVRDYSIIYNHIFEGTLNMIEAETLLSSFKIDRKAYLILIPGRLHPVKGHQDFFIGFKSFIDRTSGTPPNVQVLIAGDGWYRDELIEMAKSLSITKHIHFLGSVPNKTLLGVYKLVDLLVIPSRHEPLGNVAIEGLRTGTLMLSSDAGGLKEIIDDGVTGFLFCSHNTEDLSTKLEYLYVHRNETLLIKDKLEESFKKNFSFDSQFTLLEKVIFQKEL